jgi:transketolase
LEARAATRAVAAHRGPCYLRLGKAGEPAVHQGEIDFRLGKAIRLREGRDVTIMSTGGMLHTAMRAAERLSTAGIRARVCSMHTLKPLDVAEIEAAVRETGALFTLEEHSIIGGLGTAVAEVLAEADWPRVPFKRLGMPAAFSPHIGGQEYLLAQHGLNDSAVAATVAGVCAGKVRPC